MSALAMTCAMLDSAVRRNGQSRYRSRRTPRRSSGDPPCVPASPAPTTHRSNAEPTPNQPESMTRDGDDDSNDGIARRSSTEEDRHREAGRERRLRSPIPVRGVDSVQYSMNPGSEWPSEA